MVLKYLKLLVVFIVLCYGRCVLNAQANTIHTDASADYLQAIKYLNNKEYKHAYYFFQKVLLTESHYVQSQKSLYKEDAQYHLAFLGAKLGKEDAEDNLNILYNVSTGNKKSLLAFHLGELLFDKQNFKQASSWFDNVEEKYLFKENLEHYYFKHAYAAMELDQLNKAVNYFEKSLKISKRNYYQDAKYYLGVIAFNQKDYSKAESYLQDIQNNSNGKDVNFVLAQIQYFKKNYPEVIKLLLADNHSTLGKNGLLGKSYFETQNYLDAIAYLSKHVSENNKVNAEDMYQLAYAEYKSGLYKEAIDHFRELQLSNNFGQFAMYALADCYLKMNDKQNALTAFMQASQGSQDMIITEESRYNTAKLQYDLKNYNLAIRDLNDFVNKYPNSNHLKEAWTLLTSSLIFSNNYPQAIDILEKNVNLQEGNERLYQEICYTYALQLYNAEDKIGATKFLKKSILNPFDKPLEAEARYLRANILYKDGEIDKATNEFNEVFKIIQKEKIFFAQNATLFNTHYGLGYCAYVNKNYSEALMQFQNCVKNYKFNQNEPVSNQMQDVDIRIADIYFIQRNYDLAHKQYSKISQSRGRGYDYATLQKANIDGVKKNYSDKISTLAKLLKEVPGSTYFNDAKYQLGLAYEDIGNTTEAIIVYDEIEKKSNSQEYIPKSLVRMATLYFNKNNMPDALLKYTKVAEQYSNSPEADQALKAIKEIYITQGKPEEYISFVNKLPNGRRIEASEQDSILFQAAEELYLDENYDNAIIRLNKYLDKFPNGLFAMKSHYYKAESYAKKKMYSEAIEEYNYLTKENDNQYYERALVKSAYYTYNIQKDYTKSKSLYQKLKAIATTSQNQQVAKIGLLESNYNLKNYIEVIEVAKLIETEEAISNEIKTEAVYYRAKSYYFTKNYKSAMPLLEALVKDKTNKRSAECIYYIANIQHAQGNYKKSNEILLEAKDDYGSYESWVVKYFILIGYNYHKLGDNFQAKATLESIISNYQGDEILVKEAKEKLAEINTKMKESSKVKYK